MCSIAGIVNGSGVDKMLELQKHRAPDQMGIYKDAYLELGMGRLRIIAPNQRIETPYKEDEFVISYNGQIFNYLQIKKELLAKGWKFFTDADDEVLLKGWRQWGSKIFDKLNGMFAFAIYDSRNKKIILGRDIAGEKPLYFSKKGKKFVFASEAKALSVAIPLRPQKNKFFESFQHCLGDTLWEGVQELPAAHFLTYDLVSGNYKTTEYWRFSPRKINPKTATEELENLLDDAVKLRIPNRVPSALYYSGGIDSGLINSLASFQNRLYFDNKKNWKNDFFRKFGEIAWHLDFPVGALSSYPLWNLAERASKLAKVVITGEGADEIFGGYVRYLPIAREWELRQKYPSYKYLFNKYFNGYLDNFAKITTRNGNKEFVKERIRPYFEMFDDPINAMGFADFKLVLPSLLQMGDRMAGAFGLENRCPFLDRRVIEFGFSLPPDLKVSGLEQKVILKNILKKRGVTKPMKKEKEGLSITFNRWLGRSDWDRSVYFDLLKKEWRNVYGN